MLKITYNYGGILHCEEIEVSGNEIIADGIYFLRTDEIKAIDYTPGKDEILLSEEYFDDILRNFEELLKDCPKTKTDRAYVQGFYDGIKEFFDLTMFDGLEKSGKQAAKNHSWFSNSKW